ATGKGAVASIVSGTLVTLLWHWLGPVSVDAVLPAISVSILALILVSMLDSPPPKEKVEPFFK
ncbi:MAG: hypothetical protein KAH12_10755, partial [Anaerolineales bacterium]|nr:hypothetical protein [Anaerolineales bacterium]